PPEPVDRRPAGEAGRAARIDAASARRALRQPLKIIVVAVGKMRDRHLAAVCDDYLQRARRHVPVEVVEAEDDAALLRRIPAQAIVVALEPGGEAWTTERLTAFVDRQMVHGARAL